MGRAKGDKIRHRGDVGGPWGAFCSFAGPESNENLCRRMVLQAVAGGGGYPKGQHAGKTNRPGGRAPTGNAARQWDERGTDARLGGRNPCDARKEAIPTTRKTPPDRKTPVGARPSGRFRCQGLCGRGKQDGRWWRGWRESQNRWSVGAGTGGAGRGARKRNT